MKPVAWAVYCENDGVHSDEDGTAIYLDEEQAKDAISSGRGGFEEPLDESCGPHRVICLYRREVKR